VKARSKPRVVIVGAGNIGSYLVPLLARDQEVGELVIVDRDRYEPHNLANQDIKPADVGRWKAGVQARRVRGIAPGLEVRVLSKDIERVPWGELRGDVILTCLDSRRARMFVNLLSRRLGVLWIDAGVGGGGQLVRVSVYPPGADEPCLECSWDERDYELVEQDYPCDGPAGSMTETTPTGGSSSLGALAAALLATEWRRIHAGEDATRQDILFDADSHTSLVSTHHRNSSCRLGDHVPWTIESATSGPDELTLEKAFDCLGSAIRIERSPFTTELWCWNCDARRTTLRLTGSLRKRDLRCPRCGLPMAVPAIALRDRLEIAEVPRRHWKRTLASLGLLPGDIVSAVGPGGVRHCELA
jgi:molybdopterin/thiamine biosynthesis adenylyltransferase